MSPSSETPPPSSPADVQRQPEASSSQNQEGTPPVQRTLARGLSSPPLPIFSPFGRPPPQQDLSQSRTPSYGARQLQLDDGTDDAQAAGSSRVRKFQNAVKVDVEEKLSKPQQYVAWRARVLAALNVSNMARLVTGQEPFEAAMTAQLQNLWIARAASANNIIISALSDAVIERYASLIDEADPVKLWHVLYNDYGRGPAVNTVVIRSRIYGRVLGRQEQVAAYVEDIIALQRQLIQANDGLEEHEIAKVLMNNVSDVYPRVASDMQNQLYNWPSTRLTVADARWRIENAEQTERRDHYAFSSHSNDNGAGLTTAHQMYAVDRNRASRGKGKYKGGSGIKRSSTNRSITMPSREHIIAQKKKSSKCKACGEYGHWKNDAECKAERDEALEAANDDRGMRSMSAGAVFRSVKNRNAAGNHQLAQPSSYPVLTMELVRDVLRTKAADQLRNRFTSSSPSASSTGQRHQGMQCSRATSSSDEDNSAAEDSDEEKDGRHVEMVLAVQARPMPALKPDEVEWVLDSGSQVNLCGDISLFSYVDRDVTGELTMALGQTEALEATGSVAIRVHNEVTSKWEPRRLDDVHYSANAHVNLISLGYMQTLGFKVEFNAEQDTAWLVNGNLKLKFVKHDMLYRLRCRRSLRLVAAVAERTDVMERLHNRLDHASMDLIEKLASSKTNFGLKFSMKDLSSYECVPCITAKLKRTTYKRDPDRKRRPLEKLSMDLCSLDQNTATGDKMFMLVVDEATRYKWCYLLTWKDEAESLLMNLVRRLSTEFKSKGLGVVHLHSDKGGEFMGAELKAFCERRGISQSSTNSYSPEENAIVERANGTVLPRLRALLHATNQTNLLWGEAALHVVDTVNQLPTKPLNGKSPHEARFGKPPKLRDLRTWGCLVHAHVPPESRATKAKLEPRADLSLLLGYSRKTKGYKLMNLRTGAVFTRRSGNVYCHEKFTVAQTYMRQLLMNTFQHGDYQLPEEIPIVPIASSFQARLFPDAGRAPGLPAAPTPIDMQPETELCAIADSVGVRTCDVPRPVLQPKANRTSRSPSPSPK